MTTRSHVVHLDGPDKVGKDTLRDAIIKVTNGEVLVFVRTHISQIVYSRLYNRQIEEQFFIDDMKHLQDLGHKFFYLKANLDTIKNRCIQHHEIDVNIADLEEHIRMFDRVVTELRHSGMTIFELYTDTSVVKTLSEFLASLL